MLGVAHNILAMNAQRQYKINTDSKKKSTEKLSSGYRINRAADDAAGLTISEKMRSMIRGLNQGTDNTHDGVSFVQVADGAMNEIHDMLHRLEELAVKAANGTLTDADRQACNVEAQQILDQIDQIDYFTEFNTLDVFAKGDVTLSVKGEPGELEVFGGTDENGNYTYGGYLFHGKRIPFSEINGIEHGGTPISDGMVKMVNGQQVFKAGIYSYKDEETGCFFEIEIAKDSVTPDAKRNIKIDAKLDGLYVDGYKIDWSDVKDEDGVGVSSSNLHTGAYKFKYGGAETTLDVRNGSVVRNMTYFCASINSMTNLNENGGTSYQWITNHAFNVSEDSVSNFNFGFGTVGTKKRTIDNEFAYDTQNDNYDRSLSNGQVEFTIRTDYTSYDAAERAQYGTDDDTNFALYLTGNENKSPSGSSDAIEGTVMSMEDAGIESWSSGEDVTDGDGLIGTNTVTGNTYHYWNDDNLIPKDGVTDTTYNYADQGPKTDLTFNYNLSDITSADTVKNSMDGTVISTKYSASYHDEMTCDTSVDGNITYLSNLNNGREDFWVSYDVETALGRDFDNNNDTLATIYGNQEGSEGSGVLITYNGQVTGSNDQTITFKVQGNIASDKTSSTDLDADRKINNIDVFTFTADTSKAENNITNDIVRASTEIISNKINEVLSGRTSDGSADVNKDAQGVSLKYNVGLQSGSAGSTDGNIYDRQYYYSYEYNDMLGTLNSGGDNVSGEGKKIVVYMDNLGTLESYNYAWENKSADILNERYLHLTLDGTKADDLTYKGGSWAKGSYISLRDFYNNMSDGLTKTKEAIYYDKNVYNEISNKYTTDAQYKIAVKNEIDNAVVQLTNAFDADPTKKYHINSKADAAALFDSLGITGINDKVLASVKNQFINKVSKSSTPQLISGLDIATMFTSDDVNKMASDIVSNAKVLGDAASPAITSDNMKELISNALNRVIPSNDVETAVKNMTQAVLADSTAWARAFDKITVENGHIQYVSEATISKLADYYSDDGGIVYDLRAYYGEDEEHHKQNDTDITVDDIFNYANHITNNKAMDAAIFNDAKTYSSNALNNIALSSVYTLQANRASTITAGDDFESEKSSRAIYESEIEIESKEPMRIQHSGVQNDFTEINKFNISTAAMKIQSLRLDTQNWARRALEKLDGAMAYASEKRSYLGAVQNRLEHTLRNNENKAENLTDAESRIRDTDMAEEMVNLTKQNILTQVGEAMISQANQSNQGVLTLLGS